MPTLNERAWALCDAMVADAEQLGIVVSTLRCGTRLIDCGVKAPGSVETGLRLAEICVSGMASVHFVPADTAVWSGQRVGIGTQQPVAACMASQYAGWEIKGDDFFAMGSGPMRAAAGREPIFGAINYREQPDSCVGVLETGKLPPDSVCVELAQKCGISTHWLTLLVARTASPAGTVQIVARSLETALHKLHELGFDLSCVDRGWGTAPLPPIADNDLAAIGWTNDAILYGGYVELVVNCDDATLVEMGPRVPSSASPDFGRPFAEIFRRYDQDFYRIDPMLFSPAVVVFVNRQTGSRHEFGRYAPRVLNESFVNT
ncbi:MAG TPA: methenyltetrahydromethanopterin cyclohydrolase [Lacipirellulaceae bacterium]|nr:methenyltetrahydromethanopterin cyclohydrolase [Lacipirellulaceae bacterium]